MTVSSTPDSASLIKSAKGPVGMMFGGRGFSRERALAGASEISAVVSAQSASSSAPACAGDSELGSGLIKAAALSGELEACWTQPFAKGRTSKANPRLQLRKSGEFIFFTAGIGSL